jgi:U4/U6.U5 tri-snRNP-associated protein 2
MHTVDPAALDFDFQKVCSVSLDDRNVYACLVCGKYFQGRGPTSHAQAHALDSSHHIFLNLHTERTYCLPDGYEVVDPSLDAVTFSLRPKFSVHDVAELDRTPRIYRTLDGADHLQGITGLNNLHASDYASVVFQALLAVAPLRNFLLLMRHDPSLSAAALPATPTARLLRELSALFQKLCSPAAFRSHISPHEIMQEVSAASARRFGILHQADPTDFFAWLIHTLQRELCRAAKRPDANAATRAAKHLVQDCFQGTLEVSSERDSEEPAGEPVVTTESSTFWFLALDLPPKPLFSDASERTLVAQVPLRDLLAKYDGQSQHHVVKTGERKSFKITRLPPYLVLSFKRFSGSKFSVEKNPAVVHCPVTGLDMSDVCSAQSSESKLYNLAAVIIHDGPPQKGTYRVAVRHAATGKWFSLHNVTVVEELPQVVSMRETTLLLYARDDHVSTVVRES